MDYYTLILFIKIKTMIMTEQEEKRGERGRARRKGSEGEGVKSAFDLSHPLPKKGGQTPIK